MCNDIQATIRELRAKGIEVKGRPGEESCGTTIMLGLPVGVEIMRYEPRHVTAIGSRESLPGIVAECELRSEKGLGYNIG